MIDEPSTDLETRLAFVEQMLDCTVDDLDFLIAAINDPQRRAAILTNLRWVSMIQTRCNLFLSFIETMEGIELSPPLQPKPRSGLRMIVNHG